MSGVTGHFHEDRILEVLSDYKNRFLAIVEKRDFEHSTLDFDRWYVTVLASVVGRGGRPRRELIASRVREAALCFDNMNYRNKETKRHRKPGTEPDASTSGQRWVGTRVCLGKGGQEAEKWCSFSHFKTALTRLFPHDSTQVVDFPLLSRLRVEGVYELRVRSWELRKKVAEGGWSVRKSADCYGKVREGSRKSTKVRTDQARKSSIVRIVTPQSLFRRELHE